jgi:hypothetical protein
MYRHHQKPWMRKTAVIATRAHAGNFEPTTDAANIPTNVTMIHHEP